MKIKSKQFYIIVSLIIILLMSVQLILSNRLTVEGKKYEALQVEIDRIERESIYLKNEVASLVGLNNLIQVAEKKGFVVNPQVVDFTGKVPVALGIK